MDYNRAFSSLEQKLNVGVGHRPDMNLADVRKINEATAHFMVEYSDNAPTSKDVNEFFLKKFNSKITPFISTAKVYPKHKVITVVAQLLSLTRPATDSKTLKTVIAGQLYLDSPMEQLWEVQQREGRKILVRKIKDDIMSLVEARRNAMMTSHSHKTFASLNVNNLEKLISKLEKDDSVRVLQNGKIMDGIVLNVVGEDVEVKVDNETVIVPISTILNVNKSMENPEAEKQAMEKYFSDAYGDPSYARELVRGKGI